MRQERASARSRGRRRRRRRRRRRSRQRARSPARSSSCSSSRGGRERRRREQHSASSSLESASVYPGSRGEDGSHSTRTMKKSRRRVIHFFFCLASRERENSPLSFSLRFLVPNMLRRAAACALEATAAAASSASRTASGAACSTSGGVGGSSGCIFDRISGDGSGRGIVSLLLRGLSGSASSASSVRHASSSGS